MQIVIADKPGDETLAFARAAEAELHIPLPLAALLHRRGIDTLPALRQFLYPNLAMLPSPYTLKGMQEAVNILVKAIARREPIYIHGDYDVDGITATALLLTFFRQTGQQAVFYIPDRLQEKYGLSISSISSLLNRLQQPGRGGVLLTVDCGISSHEEVGWAKTLGLKVIITDHHQPAAILPEADAIINPKQPGCLFTSAGLSGVGVAFFLLMALRKAMVENGLLEPSAMPNLKQYLDLVALGTVADVVPLHGVNRILVRAGLEVLSKRQRIGLFFLCEQSKISHERLTAEDISFRLAPRINACGRLGKPEIGVELLIAQETDQAQKMAGMLEAMNRERRQLEQEHLDGIQREGEGQVAKGRPGLVVLAENCHPGVIGILASRLSERFYRPAIVFTEVTHRGGTVELKGSGRSFGSINLFEIISRCKKNVEQFGGHGMAVGLTVQKQRLSDFVNDFNGALLEQGGLGVTQELVVDHQFKRIDSLDAQFVHFLQLLQPFGEGNPEPVFLLSNERLLRRKNVNGHLVFQVQGSNDRHIPGIGFGLAKSSPYSEFVNLVFHVRRSWFRGVETDQIHALYLETS